MTDGDAPAVLIAAISGRALAASGRAAGYRPLVADLFGDLDTRDLAEAWAVVPGNLERGFDGAALIETLDALAQDRAPVGLVYGGGFDGRSALLEALGRRWPLLGKGAAVVAAVKAARRRALGRCDVLRRVRPLRRHRLQRAMDGSGLGAFRVWWHRARGGARS